MGSLLPLPRFLRKSALLGPLACAALLLSGCDMSGPQSTMQVEGPVARMQVEVFYVTLWVTGFIFLTVGGALAYTQIRFRARKGDDDSVPPPQSHGHPLVEIGLIVASTLLLVVIAIPTVKGIAYQTDTPDRENALVVRAIGYQWWFKFEYPDLGIVTGNEMVIPTNRPIHIELRTIDVIHSFWVPRLAGKVDLIPNRANHMWFLAERANYYWGQCAEFCGESHAYMKFRVISLEPAAFSEWEARQRAEARNVDPAVALDADAPRLRFASLETSGPEGIAAAESPFEYWLSRQVEPERGAEDGALVSRGKELFSTKTCASCHTVRGHLGSRGDPYLGISGPDLTHFGSRTTVAAGMLDNTPANLAKWIQHPERVKPGNIMWKTGYLPTGLSIADDEAEALVAYLHSLK